MSRCNTIIAAALAAAAFAAPTALAEPADFHAGPEFAARGDDLGAREAALLAQERYYSSYDDDTPLTKAPPAVAPRTVPPAVASRTGDGIARVPFVLTVLGALVVGLGAGSGLHLVRVRRRQAAGLAT